MSRYPVVVAAVLAFFLSLYLLVVALDVRLLEDPSPWLERGGAAAALVGVALLVADAVLPVPSSLVMMTLGALFGLAVGAALSLVGRTAMVLVGFAIGRRGGPLLARVVPDEERARADALLRRWGALAIVVSRPMPLVAETVAVVAGASRMSWARATVAGIAGSLPEAVLYALAGAVAATFRSAALIFVSLFVVAAVFWLVSRRVEAKLA